MTEECAPPLLSVHGVRVELGSSRRRVTAVDDVSFDVRPGERLAIIGPSGAGKSTLARLSVGLLRPQRGTVSFDGRALRRMTRAELRARRAEMQLVFQDSWGALDPRYDARTAIEAPLRIHRRPREGAAEALADLVHLPRDRLGCRPPQLSGGERQRVALARALALRPRLLILDEPLLGLDAPVARSLRGRIQALQAELRTAMVWITHELTEVQTVADKVAVMVRGRIVEMGTAHDILHRPQHSVTKALIDARDALERFAADPHIEISVGSY